MSQLTVEAPDLATCKYCGSGSVMWQVSKLGRNFLANAKPTDEPGIFAVDTFDVHNCRKALLPEPLVGTDQEFRLYVVEREQKPTLCIVYAYSAIHAKALAQLEFGPSKASASVVKPQIGVVWRPK